MIIIMTMVSIIHQNDFSVKCKYFEWAKLVKDKNLECKVF